MNDRDQQIKELTLLLAWLTSWDEGPELRRQLKASKEEIGERRKAWKGYDFGVLDELAEEGLIGDKPKRKSIDLSDEGVAEAKRLARKWIGDES
jgi:DNA-binding PadR family transcriptional regulator